MKEYNLLKSNMNEFLEVCKFLKLFLRELFSFSFFFFLWICRFLYG